MAKFVSFQSKAADIGDIYGQMFGRDVVFKPLSFTHKVLDETYIVATFKNENDQVIGAIIFDTPLAAAMSMAFTEMPPESVKELLASDRFTHDLWENLHEIFNISCRVFSLRKERQVRLSQMFQHDNLPKGLKTFLQNSKGDAFSASVAEYGVGECMIAQAEHTIPCFPSSKPTLYDSFQEAESTPEPVKKTAPKPTVRRSTPKKTEKPQSNGNTAIVIVGLVVAAAIAFFALQR